MSEARAPMFTSFQITIGIILGLILLPTATCVGCVACTGGLVAVGQANQAIHAPAIAKAEAKKKDCLKVDDFGSSVLETNNVYQERAWKAKITNSCDETFSGSVRFSWKDKDQFELDSDHESFSVGPNETKTITGRQLISPPDKARRIAYDNVQLKSSLY